VPQYPTHYDIEMVEYGAFSELKEAHKLIISPADNIIEFRKDKKSHALFVIPVRNIERVVPVRQTRGTIRQKDYLTLEITFRPTTGIQPQSHLISFHVDQSYIDSIQSYIQYLKDAEYNPVLKRQIKSDLQPDLCAECFEYSYLKFYGTPILYAENAEYHGGHKAYLAGGVFGKSESGKMTLSRSHLIFLKEDRNPLRRIDIVIPLESVSLERWTVREESRRKDLSGGGIGYEGIGIGGLSMQDSGKSHRLVVPYIDENDVPQQPTFGVSSFRGKAIREWASELYARVIDAQSRKRRQDTISTPATPIKNEDSTQQKKVEARISMSAAPITIFRELRNDEGSSNSNHTGEAKQPPKERTSNKNDDLIHTLKMRLVKGEISKEEYLELRKLIE
jgi:hypothetical protein